MASKAQNKMPKIVLLCKTSNGQIILDNLKEKTAKMTSQEEFDNLYACMHLILSNNSELYSRYTVTQLRHISLVAPL